VADTTTSFVALTKPGNLDPAGSGLWGPKLNTDFDIIDGEFARPRIQFQSPTVGGTTTLDLAQGRAFVFTVSQATTIAFANVPSSSFFVRIVCIITNGAAFALTWPASVTWLTGGVPLFQVAGVDAVELLTKDGGTTWYARPLHGGYARAGAAAATAHVSQVLFQTNSLSTASTSEVSLTTFSLPAATLNINGRQIRITLGGAATNTAIIRIKFGASYVLDAAGGTDIASGGGYFAQLVLARTGAATQQGSSFVLGGVAGAILIESATAAETLANAITIDVRGNLTGAGTLTVQNVLIELLAV